MFKSSMLALTLLMAPTTMLEAETASQPKAIKIIDTSGSVVEIKDTRIDYYNGSYLNESDYEYDGIRIRQGKAIVGVSWSKIDQIRMLNWQDGEDKAGLQAEITFSGDATPKRATLPEPWQELEGQTELGEYKIELSDIKMIEVLR